MATSPSKRFFAPKGPASHQHLLAKAEFIDGKLSAGKLAKKVKHNQEVAAHDPSLQRLNETVIRALNAHPLYQAAALPQKVATPFYARYTQGMEYGSHVDDPVMGRAPQQYRSDIAVTVFLTEPETYSGGELVIRTSFGEQYVKFPAGDAVIYPASSLHRVDRVSQGERLVAVTWVQSLVRDPVQRELLFDLFQAREQLRLDLPEHDATGQVDRVYVNLVRRWAMP